MTEIGRAFDQRRILIVGDVHGRDHTPCPISSIDVSLSTWVNQVVKDVQSSPFSGGTTVTPVNILLEIDRAHPLDNLEVSHTFIHDVAKDNLECLKDPSTCVDRVVIPIDVRLSTTIGCWEILFHDLADLSRTLLDRMQQDQDRLAANQPIEPSVSPCQIASEATSRPLLYPLPDRKEYKLTATQCFDRLKAYTMVEDEFVRTGQLICNVTNTSKVVCDLPIGIINPSDRGYLLAQIALFRERSKTLTPSHFIPVLDRWFNAIHSGCKFMTPTLYNALTELTELDEMLIEHFAYL
jgi:hypothetical protein